MSTLPWVFLSLAIPSSLSMQVPSERPAASMELELRVVDTGLASFGAFALSNELVAFLVPEAAQGGVDLNGDGDATDSVIHAFHGPSGTVHNTGFTGSAPQGHGAWMLCHVHENHQGNTDLNGDGDAFDHVAVLHDPTSGTTDNLGLAVRNTVPGLFPGSSLRFGILLVDELAQGATDLNGDGDTNDAVLHVYDAPTGIVRNLGIALPTEPGKVPLTVDEHRIAFGLHEVVVGGDLNGDGDMNDSVLQLYDAATDVLANTGIAVGHALRMRGRLVATIFDEDELAQDIDGDGDTFDVLLGVCDLVIGTSSFTVVDWGEERVLPPYDVFAMNTRAVVFTTFESVVVEDLNGDGDTVDEVVTYYAAGSERALGLAVWKEALHVAGDTIVFHVREASQGAVDLNGDGDSGDTVLHRFRLSTGATVNSSKAMWHAQSGRPLPRFVPTLVSEAGEGEDLNGDGDTLDAVAHAYNLNTGELANSHTAVIDVSANGPNSILSVSEQDVGDLNQDGDSVDDSFLVWDVASGAILGVGVAAWSEPVLVDGGFLFTAHEQEEGIDLNGDGDLLDQIVQAVTVRYTAR